MAFFPFWPGVIMIVPLPPAAQPLLLPSMEMPNRLLQLDGGAAHPGLATVAGGQHGPEVPDGEAVQVVDREGDVVEVGPGGGRGGRHSVALLLWRIVPPSPTAVRV